MTNETKPPENAETDSDFSFDQPAASTPPPEPVSESSPVEVAGEPENDLEKGGPENGLDQPTAEAETPQVEPTEAPQMESEEAPPVESEEAPPVESEEASPIESEEPPAVETTEKVDNESTENEPPPVEAINTNNEGLSNFIAPVKSMEITPDAAHAIENSQRILSYVTNHSGLKIQDEYLQTIVHAKSYLRQKHWTLDAEVRFWKAYDQLSVAIHPVRVSNIIANQSLDLHKMTPSRKAIWGYSGLGVGLLFLLIILQLYWFIGIGIFSKTETLFQQYTASELQPEKASETLRQHSQLLKNWSQIWKGVIGEESSSLNQSFDPAHVQHRENIQFFAIKARIQAEQLAASASVNRGFQLTPTTPTISPKRSNPMVNFNAKDDVALLNAVKQTLLINGDKSQSALWQDFQKLEQEIRTEIQNYATETFTEQTSRLVLTSQFILELLQYYFLPLLYGLLGSVTFVVRSLIREVRTLTYTNEMVVQYWWKFCLGGLGGIAIGWLFKSSLFLPSGTVLPFLLAILVGYHTDLLFAFMDKAFVSLMSLTIPSQKPVKWVGPSDHTLSPSSRATKKGNDVQSG